MSFGSGADGDRARSMADFNALHWPLNRVLRWIAFRKIEGLKSDDGLREQIFHDLMYRQTRDLVDGNPIRSLLLALRTNKLRAFDSEGRSLPAEFWAHRDFDRRHWPAVLFHRNEVLAAFDDPTAPVASTAKARPAMPSRIATFLNEKYPDGRPPKTRKELIGEIEGSGIVRKVSDQTLGRALREAWPKK